MTRGPLPFRRRRFIAIGPLPTSRGWLPFIAVGMAFGFLLYWADVTFYDAAFHPVRSLRDVVYSLGEVLVEIARMLPFVIVTTAIAVGVGALVRRRRAGTREDGRSLADSPESRA
jgi:hypothetical protein